MPSSSSSSAQAARQALADQLREIRERAGLTGRVLAATAGWQPQKISRIEHGVRPISAADLSLWCQLCGVPAQRLEELLAERSAAAGMWTLDAERRLRWPCEGFVMLEGPTETKVTVEAVSGYLQITAPSEIALYRREFDDLLGHAVTGERARRIIEMAAAQVR